MDVPNLDRIVDTYIPMTSHDLSAYLGQLRSEVLPEIRRLERNEKIRWFAFLIHGPSNLDRNPPPAGNLFIHLRLEPDLSLNPTDFLRDLPAHFLDPQLKPLGGISGIDQNLLTSMEWAHAWKIHGESSDWVLNLLEGHDGDVPVEQTLQFLHFIANPLLLGNRCLFFPNGFIPF